MSGHGVRERLGRTFLLQAVWIGAAAIVGVLLAWLLLEDVLIRSALRSEAAHYWTQRATDPAFALPNTRNMIGYLRDAPAEISGLPPGFHDWDSPAQRRLVLVDERDGERLYLAFDAGQVRGLATWFGLIPLGIVLLVLYVSTWLGFRASRRAVSPVVALAREVRMLDPDAAAPQLFRPAESLGADEEVVELASAITRYTERLQQLVNRERQFTRDASHELRSPLTVMRAAAELLLSSTDLTERDRPQVERIKRASREMEELIAAFLLLARENETGLPLESVSVNAVLGDELEKARLLAAEKPIAVAFEERCVLLLDAPEKVLSVLLGNLLRNAFSYTDAGTVRVEVSPWKVTIEDSGVGMPPERIGDMYRPFVRGDAARRGGHGVGLTIVRRLSDRFGWPVEIQSSPGVGTRVDIGFPNAIVEEIPASSRGLDAPNTPL
jgi:signal transduction histidine kinase